MNKLLVSFLFAAALLAPVPALAQEEGVCPGFESRLTVGEPARVLPGPANNVRSAPTTNAAQVGQIEGGETFMVLEGPVCAEGYTWWHVDHWSAAGWTAEGKGSDYWLEPADTYEVVVAAGERQLPDDALQALAQTGMGGGGGGGQGTCQPDMEVVFVLESGVGAFSVEAGPLEQYQAGETIPVVDFGGVSLLGMTDSPGFMPAICSVEPVAPEEAVAVSPGGEEVAPDIMEIVNWEDGSVLGYQVHLPLEAYMQTGIWRLRVGDFEIHIDVQEVEEPNMLAQGASTFILTGFTPGERVVMVAYLQGEDFETLPVAFIEAQADEKGYLYANPEEPIIYMFAVVGEDKHVYSMMMNVPDPMYPRYFLDPETAGALLYAMIWEGEKIDLRTQPCPSALPIRLFGVGESGARVVRSAPVPVYAEPGDEATVMGELRPGAAVEMWGGLACTPGQTWWQIDYGDEYGWVAEGDETYWLEPDFFGE